MPSGAFRFVFFLGNLAIKLPRLRNFTYGLRSNRWEREMWKRWHAVFKWQTLCPVYASDPFGLMIVMPRASQPVSQDEVDALPDYYPDITAEAKPDDYGHLNGRVVALDYGLPFKDMILQRRRYYEEHTHKPAMNMSE